ncbi:uncharacterized protein PGTG_15567 [Puccinia graminis f. sp. tritici CRL 75-36-700-3]|uniref:Uncharacterized protein n=1 Tax=Puccinia graminis f. sp. tritici (strain CRL 75-36-700-3 / race SCCL) TaxID=418459 RepID=E3KZ79_PUCGT|nr:uncharacterized protein PGTG_15567 [Puccinia graminis f. sp. tritici CRL 75-36-700-3]EFP89604.1 hypothetical protein PGTG_15567 [Puccinia graminis f. sp. tritici CRL 75-36-700-3]
MAAGNDTNAEGECAEKGDGQSEESQVSELRCPEEALAGLEDDSRRTQAGAKRECVRERDGQDLLDRKLVLVWFGCFVGSKTAGCSCSRLPTWGRFGKVEREARRSGESRHDFLQREHPGATIHRYMSQQIRAYVIIDWPHCCAKKTSVAP